MKIILISLLGLSIISATEIVNITYDDWGQITKQEFTDGSSVEKLYDPSGSVIQIITTSATIDTNTKDSDGDGLTDEYEDFAGLNPDDAGDAEQDSDGDSYSNADEFTAGTDPLAKQSALSVTQTEDGISWSSVPGKFYDVMHSSDLKEWEIIESQIYASSANDSMIFSKPNYEGFYRIRVGASESRALVSNSVIKESDKTFAQLPSPEAFELLGYDVDICGDTAIASTNPNANFNDSDKAKLVIFNRNESGAWSIEQIEEIPLSEHYGNNRIAISSRGVFVGCPMSNSAPYPRTGYVMVYKKGGDGLWQETERILPPEDNLAYYQHFGKNISLDHDYLAVSGAHNFLCLYRQRDSQWIYENTVVDSESSDISYAFAKDQIIKNDLLVVSYLGVTGGQVEYDYGIFEYPFISNTPSFFIDRPTDIAYYGRFAVSSIGHVALYGEDKTTSEKIIHIYSKLENSWSLIKELANVPFTHALAYHDEELYACESGGNVHLYDADLNYEKVSVFSPDPRLHSDGSAYLNYMQSIGHSGNTIILGEPLHFGDPDITLDGSKGFVHFIELNE